LDLFPKFIFGVSNYLQRRSQRWQTTSALGDLRLWDLSVNSCDHLEVDGIDVTDLVDNFGSPLFICNRKQLEKDILEFKKALFQAFGGGKALYSYKTNCIPTVLKAIHTFDIGAEVISPYELWLADNLGVPGNLIVYNGMNKTLESLRHAVALNVLSINIDSLEEIDRLYHVARECQQKVRIGLRLGLESRTQFGLDIESGEAMAAIDRIAACSDWIDLYCLHFNTISNARESGIHKRCVKTAIDIMYQIKKRHNIEIAYLDIGGGFGVPTVKTLSRLEYFIYLLFGSLPRPPELSQFQSIQSWLTEVNSIITAECRRLNLKMPEIITEPGRYLTSRSMFLLTKVLSVKSKKNRKPFVITEAGRYSAAFPMGFEHHAVWVANRVRATSMHSYQLVGRVCSAGDWLIKNVFFPILQAGDLIAIMDAGAYFWSYSSNFAFPRPAVVMVTNGRARLVRREETFEHLVAMDNLD
jgi:diaminopimelate decarboxylase